MFVLMGIRYTNAECRDCGKIKPKALATRYFQSPYCRSCAIKYRWARDRKPPLICQKCGQRFPYNQSGSNPRFNLLIECDGRYWHSQKNVKQRDAAKTRRAERLGYRVERLSEDLIKSSYISPHLSSLLRQQSLL